MSTSSTTEAETDDVYVGKVFALITDVDTRLTEGYDELRVFRRKSATAAWAEISKATTSNPGARRLPLKSGTCNYFYSDPNAKIGYEYRFEIYDDAEVLTPVPLNEVDAVDTSYEAILTIEELKRIYLFGVDLTNDENEPFPDVLFAHYIQTAISQVEHELDLSLLPEKLTENYDHFLREYERYGFVQLSTRPLISVDKVSLTYPSGSEIIDFPIEWIRTKHFAGQFEILPARGTFTQLLVSAGGGFLPLVFGGSNYIPDILQVEYTAGFLPGGSGIGRTSMTAAQRLPHAIKEVVGKKAAFGPFNTAGDLIVGAGIATRSVSIDGLSETIGTTSSATNAGFGSRLIQYEKELKKAMTALQKYFNGGRLQVA